MQHKEQDPPGVNWMRNVFAAAGGAGIARHLLRGAVAWSAAGPRPWRCGHGGEAHARPAHVRESVFPEVLGLYLHLISIQLVIKQEWIDMSVT